MASSCKFSLLCWCWVLNLLRMRSPWMRTHMEPHSVQLSLEVTKLQFPWPQDKMTIIHCIYPMGWFIIMFIVHIAMLFPWLDFCLSQKALTCTSFVSDTDKAITADRDHQNSPEFCEFCCHLFHDSLWQILVSLKDGMQTSEVVLYADRHYHRTIYGLGPYIADCPEQVLLAYIVQEWCCR